MLSTLFQFCKSRYTENSLHAQTEAMTPENRQSLAEKIVETLTDNRVADEEDGAENVEGLLDRIEVDLEVANRKLAELEENEGFLTIRIHRYQSLLKEQADHLDELHRSIPRLEEEGLEDERVAEQLHYQAQLEKQQKHNASLGKVVDVHMEVLKSIVDSKRIIATLEQKEYELKNVTKTCREFLVLAEEAEREQQIGIEPHDDEKDLQMMEMAPIIKGKNDETLGEGKTVEEKVGPASGKPEGDLEVAGLLIKETDPSGDTESREKGSNVPSKVDPVELKNKDA